MLSALNPAIKMPARHALPPTAISDQRDDKQRDVQTEATGVKGSVSRGRNNKNKHELLRPRIHHGESVIHGMVRRSKKRDEEETMMEEEGEQGE